MSLSLPSVVSLIQRRSTQIVSLYVSLSASLCLHVSPGREFPKRLSGEGQQQQQTTRQTPTWPWRHQRWGCCCGCLVAATSGITRMSLKIITASKSGYLRRGCRVTSDANNGSLHTCR